MKLHCTNRKPYQTSLFGILVLLLSIQTASSQIFIETGLPQTVNVRNKPNFFGHHGAYAHVGFDAEKYTTHMKLYSGPSNGKITEYGIGYGFARRVSFDSIPRLNINLGLGGLYVQKRQHEYVFMDYDFPSIFIETQARYYIFKQAYLSTSISLGFGKEINRDGNYPNLWAMDAPYLLSFGIGWKMQDTN